MAEGAATPKTGGQTMAAGAAAPTQAADGGGTDRDDDPLQTDDSLEEYGSDNEDTTMADMVGASRGRGDGE